MKTSIDTYQKTAEALANLFAPMLEVALFNGKHELLHLYNRLTHDALPIIEPHQAVAVTINHHQAAKMMIVPLTNNFYLRLVVETELFTHLHAFLNTYLQKTENKDVFNHWQQHADQLIHQQLQERRTTLSGLTNQDKRALVKIIHEKGLFDYQDAAKYLAQKLHVSRATIYNYLKQASQIKSLQIHQVDAFTDQPFSGNPGGVVLDADALDEAMMKKIAREMNLSETAFVLASKKADLRLRYFTPTGHEVKFCGHSTVATLYMLAHKKMLGIQKPGHYHFQVEAQVGIIETAITLKPDQSIAIQFRSPKVELTKSKFSHQVIAEALGISLEVIDPHQHIMFEKTNQDLFITVKSLKQLGELQIDQKAAKLFAEKNNIVVFVLLCAETIAKHSHIHMRCFAPAVGIPEDPFTGSVLGGLANYLIENRLINSTLKVIRVEQGHFVARPGYVELELDRTHKNAAPLITAKARHFFSTEINL